MRRTVWHRLDGWSRSMTPFVLTVVLVVINVVPLHVPGFARVVPILPLMAVYHWTINRPELMPALAVFVIGVLHDTLSGTPIGVWAVVFLTVYGVVSSQRRFFVGKSFAVIWLGFALVSAGAALEAWALVTVYHAHPVGPRALTFQYLLTLGFYPLLAWFFTRWQLAFLKQE